MNVIRRLPWLDKISIYINTYVELESQKRSDGVLDYILLGLLREPASGYELKRLFDERIHYFWAAELSQIYVTLQRLERKGLLRSSQAQSKRGPGRRMYQITATGRRTLRAWLEIESATGDDRIPYLAKLYLMDEAQDLRKTLRYLQNLREQFGQKLTALEMIERRWKREDPAYPTSLPARLFHVMLTLRNGILLMAARVQWANESIACVESRMKKEGNRVRTISGSANDAHRIRKRGTRGVLGSHRGGEGRKTPR
jgi:PadR family transcriptional regulator, regulatory protein AphA